MIEENEEIVRAYFEAQGYLVKSNVRYQDRASNRGMGWSDVDLVVQHPISGDAAAVEVKGWHTEAITPAYLKEWPQLFHFTRPAAVEAVAGVLGTEDFRKSLVVGRLGPQKAAEVRAYAREREVEILTFPEIIDLLIERTPLNRSASSQTEHCDPGPEGLRLPPDDVGDAFARCRSSARRRARAARDCSLGRACPLG